MTLAALPAAYGWIDKEPGPRLLLEMRKLFGTKEAPGHSDNPTIVEWAEDIGVQNFHDATPWCGLTMAYAALQAGWEHPVNPLWAANWLNWGTPVSRGSEMLGDVLVFHREGGNHVAEYLGEDRAYFHIMGGNQGDAVSIERKAKSLLLGARRCPWRINQPNNVRKIWLAPEGAPLAVSEA